MPDIYSFYIYIKLYIKHVTSTWSQCECFFFWTILHSILTQGEGSDCWISSVLDSWICNICLISCMVVDLNNFRLWFIWYYFTWNFNFLLIMIVNHLGHRTTWRRYFSICTADFIDAYHWILIIIIFLNNDLNAMIYCCDTIKFFFIK